MVAAFTIAASAAVAAANATKTLTLPGGATMELIYVAPGEARLLFGELSP